MQADDGVRGLVRSGGLEDVYARQGGRLSGTEPEGALLGPLGPEGLRALAAAAEAGRPLSAPWATSPRAARLTSPCIRCDDALIFAPFAGYDCSPEELKLRDLSAIFDPEGNEI